jgi:hypothetical protein
MERFLDTPYIPIKRVKRVLLDMRTPKETIKYIKDLNIEIIFSPVLSELYEAVSGHSDLFIHHIRDNIFVTAPNTYNYFHNLMSKLGFNIIKGYREIKRTYPDNIAYNVSRVGNIAFHNKKHTDKKVLEQFEENDIKLVHVNQGYAKCSMCVLNEKSIITSDRGIYDTVVKYNIDALLIKPGFFKLCGVDYGFIGGASGLISDRELLLTGNIELHSDYNKIIDFCEKNNVKLLYPKDVDCTDVGSIIPICYY